MTQKHSLNQRRQQKAFTLLEMLAAVIILIVVSTAVFQLFNDYLFRARRLSTLSYSNQEIEKLRTMIFRDMRAATSYEISNNGMELRIICAVDEAAVKGDSLQENTDMALEGLYPNSSKKDQIEAAVGGTVDIEAIEGGDDEAHLQQDAQGNWYFANIYYTVQYTYLPEYAYTAMTVMDPNQDQDPSINQTATFLSQPGMWRLRRGVIVRTGPPFNPETGSVDFDQLQPYMYSQQNPTYPPAMVVSDVWAYKANQIGGIFSYWRPDKSFLETTKEEALGVRVALYPRQIFSYGSRRTEHRQVFEAIVTPRTRR